MSRVKLPRPGLDALPDTCRRCRGNRWVTVSPSPCWSLPRHMVECVTCCHIVYVTESLWRERRRREELFAVTDGWNMTTTTEGVTYA